MCTVVIEVPADSARPIRVLAVRDEDPARPWDPPGRWWPERNPDLVGVRDRRAGGAWLAAEPEAGSLAVILNRGEAVPLDPERLGSRGALVLDNVSGTPLPEHPNTASFNLLEAHGAGTSGSGRVIVHTWDGTRLRSDPLSPGVHMIAHDELDDPSTARIVRWLPEFQRLGGLPDHEWRAHWSELLRASTELSPRDDRAIIRDNRPFGFPTLSLLACSAEVASDRVSLETRVFERPGEW